MGLFAFLTNMDSWSLTSKDGSGHSVEGQFPTEITHGVSSEYAQFKALNRETPVVQFLSGNSDTLSVPVRFFARDITAFRQIKKKLKRLKKWAKRDSKLQRPHVLSFKAGSGFLKMRSCVLTSVAPIKYEKPTIFGNMKDVTLTLNLLAYKEFTMDDEGVYETRYHRARYQDYYEMLCWSEYGNAYLGDVIRKRHPNSAVTHPGDVIKLPSIEAIQKSTLEPKSLVLKNSYRKKQSPQRAARLRAFDRTNRSYVSHTVVE